MPSLLHWLAIVTYACAGLAALVLVFPKDTDGRRKKLTAGALALALGGGGFALQGGSAELAERAERHERERLALLEAEAMPRLARARRDLAAVHTLADRSRRQHFALEETHRALGEYFATLTPTLEDTRRDTELRDRVLEYDRSGRLLPLLAARIQALDAEAKLLEKRIELARSTGIDIAATDELREELTRWLADEPQDERSLPRSLTELLDDTDLDAAFARTMQRAPHAARRP